MRVFTESQRYLKGKYSSFLCLNLRFLANCQAMREKKFRQCLWCKARQVQFWRRTPGVSYQEALQILPYLRDDRHREHPPPNLPPPNSITARAASTTPPSTRPCPPTHAPRPRLFPVSSKPRAANHLHNPHPAGQSTPATLSISKVGPGHRTFGPCACKAT